MAASGLSGSVCEGVVGAASIGAGTGGGGWYGGGSSVSKSINRDSLSGGKIGFWPSLVMVG